MESVVDDAGTISYYRGFNNAKRLVRMQLANGEERFYKGEKGAERLVRTRRPCGEERFYEGGKGQECCMYIRWPNGLDWSHPSFGKLDRATWVRRKLRMFNSRVSTIVRRLIG